MASGMPAFEMVFNLNSMSLNSIRTSVTVSPILVWFLSLFRPSNLPNQHEHGIIEFINHALLQGNDRIVRDADLLGTNFGAALGDVAEADAKLILKHTRARFRVERMHFEGCNPDEKSRSSELLHLVVIAENVAHILA